MDMVIDPALPMTVSGLLAALVLSTVWHELGHLLAARLCGVPVRLLIFGLGPVVWRHTLPAGTRLELRALPLSAGIGVLGRRTADGHARRPLSHDFAVAAGGPSASVILSAILVALAFLGQPTPDTRSWLVLAAMVSALLGATNLLPIPGLDGGHLVMLTLAHFGWQLSPQREAAVQRLGIQLTAGLCVIFAVSAWVFRIS